ncbi:phosphatidylserine decarboxylase, partial [bacterium]|nr:phosphatidylserine decarboxylase [bacterium]
MRLAPQGATIWGSCAVFGAVLTVFKALFVFPIWIAIVGWLPFIAAAWFFRDPDRKIPVASDVVIAPADGKIIVIDSPEEKYESFGFQQKISIFMSPLNVHVNRIPSTGLIAELKYKKGRFLTAFHDKASELNEQQFIALQTEHGMVGFVQIAGWLARRIVCQLQVGQQ